MSCKKGFIHLSLLILLVFTIGATGLFILQSQSRTKSWKTYNNEAFGIKFNYPSELTAVGLASDGVTLFNKKNRSQNYRINFFRYVGDYNSIDGFVTQKICNSTSCVSHFIENKNTIIINDNEMTKSEFIKDGMVYPIVVIPNEGFFDVFYLFDDSESREGSKVFDDVISTVEITYNPQTVEKPDEAWSPVYGHSLCDDIDIENFDVVVEPNFGMSNIAREAMRDYFTAVSIRNIPSQHVPKDALDAEERTYVEDYIRKQLAPVSLEVGESVDVPCFLVEVAMFKARQLSVSEKENIEQYSENVTDHQLNEMIRDIIEEATKDSDLKPTIIEF